MCSPPEKIAWKVNDLSLWNSVSFQIGGAASLCFSMCVGGVGSDQNLKQEIYQWKSRHFL